MRLWGKRADCACLDDDPWIASDHLNGFLLLMPVFHRGEVIRFTSCTSHLVEVGGKGTGPEREDIFDDGLLIPPCKLVEAGQINALLLNIVQANSRGPVANEGDICALIACCEVGAQRLVEMMEEFGLDHLRDLSTHIIEISRKRYRIEPGERLIFDTPGGGGIGPPEDRAIDDIARDLVEGLINEDAAHNIYGNTP